MSSRLKPDWEATVQRLQPDEPIEVTLTAVEWNAVLQVMAEAPIAHRVVDPLIRAIQQQCCARSLSDGKSETC